MGPPNLINSPGILSISGVFPLFGLFIDNSTSEFKIGNSSSLLSYNESLSIYKGGILLPVFPEIMSGNVC